MIRPSIALALSAVLLSSSAIAQPAASGWFGTWQLRLKDASEEPETLIYTDAGRGAMRMRSIEEGSDLVTRFDGKPVKTGGKDGGTTALAIKATSPTSYDWTFYKAGKPWVRGRNALAPDRQSFTEESWLVAKPAGVVRLVYDRK